MALFLPAVCPSSNLCCGEDAVEFVTCAEALEERNLSLLPVSDEIPQSLLAGEDDHMPRADYVSRCLSGAIDLTARQDAINWILKVSEFYRFRPVTAYLSVNYLDRFLSANALPAAHLQNFQQHFSGVWPMQLLSVACLSAASKMEETNVPLLLDLQILNPKFIFEPRTICRMELLLMSTLRWRMRSVTPFDFLPYFASAIQTPAVFSPDFYSRSTDLILRTIRVIDFLRFRPSAIAAAAVLCATSQSPDSSVSLNFHEMINKVKVNECRQLIEDYVMDTCPTAPGEKTASPENLPGSPAGVLDAAACASCETQRSSASYLPNPDAGGADLPPAKRRRIHDCF